MSIGNSEPASHQAKRRDHPGLQLFVCEEFLSAERFPLSLLSEESKEMFERYRSWLDSLPKKEAQEVAFATLLTGRFPKLFVDDHEDS